jgi:hypothetical protein
MTSASTVVEAEGRHRLISPRWTQCLAVSTNGRDAVPRADHGRGGELASPLRVSLRLVEQCVGRLNTRGELQGGTLSIVTSTTSGAPGGGC